MVDPTSKIHMVRCKDCSLVEGKDKIINLKLDCLQQHARKRKALISHRGVLASYISNDSQHQRSERAYSSQGLDSIAKLVVNGGKTKIKNKSNLWQFFIFKNMVDPCLILSI